MKMSDLAKIAGVSKSTVSRALADSPRVTPETRAHIRALAEKYNYRLDTRARNFRLKNVLTIGVLLPSNGRADWLATDPFVLELLGSIADALESRGGHELLLAKHTGNDPSWIEDFARNRGVDGIIVIGQSLYHRELNSAAELHKAMVVWGTELPDQKYITVGSDNYLGGTMATQHLLDRGRRNFAFLGDIRYPETRLRFEGYRDTLIRAGLNYATDLTTDNVEDTDLALSNLSTMLRANPRVDALVAATDMLGISAIKTITKAGLSVPKDVSVVGYDNITLAEFSSPTLTSVTQDRIAAGAVLVEKLFELIEDKEPGNTVISTELVVRESSGLSRELN